jgi:DNA-binding NarL/FixJ family response regulator
VTKKTLIASKDASLRHALEFLFNTEPNARVTGSISNSVGLLALAQVMAPDLVLLDWGLTEEPIDELLDALRKINPAVKTIVISNPAAEKKALGAGADACVSKSHPPEALLEAFHSLWQSNMPKES